MNGQAGELVTCQQCSGKDWEIRFGTPAGQPPPNATCPGCLTMYWLEAYVTDPGDGGQLAIRMVPVIEAFRTRAPDYPP